jgi:hypothetical protein
MATGITYGKYISSRMWWGGLTSRMDPHTHYGETSRVRAD